MLRADVVMNVGVVALLPRRPGGDGLLRLVEHLPEIDVIGHVPVVADLEHTADFLQVGADRAGEGKDELEVAFSGMWNSVGHFCRLDWVDKSSRRT